MACGFPYCGGNDCANCHKPQADAIRQAEAELDEMRQHGNADDATEAAAHLERLRHAATLPFDRWPKLAQDAYEALEKHLEQGPSFPLGLLIQIRVGIAGRAVDAPAGMALTAHESGVTLPDGGQTV